MRGIYSIKKGRPPVYVFYADYNALLSRIGCYGLVMVLNHFPCGFDSIIIDIEKQSNKKSDM